MTALGIGWAVRGKPAGSLADYTILSTGGSVFGPRDLAKIFSWFSLGNPPPERVGIGVLPWIAISVVHKDGRHHIGITIHKWSADRDGAGRPIVLSFHFFVPFDELRVRGTSYRTVLALVQDVALPADGKELRVDLDDIAPDELPATIDGLGRDRVARTAAMLLDGPVTVTGAETLSLADRMAFLDAVAALLPYGWRTRFAAGTWYDAGGPMIGLAFGPRTRPGSTELNWAAPGRPAEGAGTAYLYWLEELIERRGWPLERLLGELAAAGEPLAECEPADAVRILEDLDWPTTVLLKAQQSEMTPEELAALFRGGRHRELNRADAAFLFNQLVELGRTEDLPLVEQLWHSHDGRPEALIHSARARLWRNQPESGGQARAELAARLGFGEEFLAGLVRAPRSSVVRADASAEVAVAELVWAHGVPTGEELPKALAGHGAVLGELFVQIGAEPDGDPEPWLEALFPHTEESLLRPFDQIWVGPLTITMLDGLEPHGPLCVPALVRTATMIKELEHLLPVLASWLAPAGTTACLPLWAALLETLETPYPAERGTLDALIVWLGGSPRYFENVRDGDLPTYVEAFLAVFRPPRPDDDMVRVAEALARYFRQTAWARSPELTDAVTSLAAGFPDQRVLMIAVLAGRAVNRGLTADRNFDHWRSSAFGRHPMLEKEEAMAILTDLPAHAEPEAVATLCADAILTGQRPDEVIDGLARSGWPFDDDRAMRLLVATRRNLADRGVPADDAGYAALSMGVALMRVLNAGHQGLAESLRHTASVRGVEEMTFLFNLILTLTQDPQKKKVFRLEENSRKQLQVLVDEARRILGGRRRG